MRICQVTISLLWPRLGKPRTHKTWFITSGDLSRVAFLAFRADISDIKIEIDGVHTRLPAAENLPYRDHLCLVMSPTAPHPRDFWLAGAKMKHRRTEHHWRKICLSSWNTGRFWSAWFWQFSTYQCQAVTLFLKERFVSRGGSTDWQKQRPSLPPNIAPLDQQPNVFCNNFMKRKHQSRQIVKHS